MRCRWEKGREDVQNVPCASPAGVQQEMRYVQCDAQERYQLIFLIKKRE